MVAIIRTQRRTAQPQIPVGIDWSNPLTRPLTDVVSPALWLGNRVPITQQTTTQFSTGFLKTPTPHGLGFVEPTFGAGVPDSLSSTFGDTSNDLGFVCALYIKDGSITNANGMSFCRPSAGKGYSTTATTTENFLYWINTAGERKLGFFGSWTNTTLEIGAVPNGLHVLASCQGQNKAPLLFMDGALVATGAVETSYLYKNGLAYTSFDAATLSSTGVGNVLLRARFGGVGAYNPAAYIELTRNPWQIFSAGPK